jgi:hypothetical protein
VRWNAIIDTGGTPPRLKGKSRNPDEIAAEITAIADENDCDVEIYFDRFSWAAYITLKGRSSDEHQANADARKALEVLEADGARQELNVEEKSRHPNAGMSYDAAT